MRLPVALLVALLGLAWAAPLAAKSSRAQTGEWVGGFEIAHRWIFCRIVVPETDTADATIDIPSEGILGRTLEDLQAGRAQITFRAQTPSGVLAFQGQLRSDSFAGAVSRDTLAGRFEMWRTQPVEPWLFGDYSAADAMFAPVALRFLTYGLPLSRQAGEYLSTVLAERHLREWLAAAASEGVVIPADEAGTPA